MAYEKYGSDVIVDMMRAYKIPYVSLNPGATYRGLHDSLVNYGKNEMPIVTCTHEETAVEIAHAGGHHAAELRALSNLASVVSAEDPRRAHAATLASLELARRVGHRSMSIWSLMFHGWWSYLEGLDWDGVILEMEDEIEKGIAPVDEARLLGMLSLYRQNRGEPADDILARRDELIAGASDPTLRAVQDWALGSQAFFNEDYEAAGDLYLRAGVPGVVYPLGLAARAALWGRDLERLRVAVARLDADPEVPHDARLLWMAARAGLAALEGRWAEAIAGYRDTLRRARDTGQAFEEAVLGLDFLIAVGPDEPEARRTAEESRPTFERQRARPYLEKLDEALAAAPDAPTSPRSSATPSVGADRPRRLRGHGP